MNVKEVRLQNKGWFDRTHRLRPRKIEEGDWVLVYNSSLDNQRRSMWKFAMRWFWLYVVKSTNVNATYHLAELDGTRIVVLIMGKPIKAFKKRLVVEPDPEVEDEDTNEDREPNDNQTNDISEQDE